MLKLRIAGIYLPSSLHSSFDAEIDRETEEYGGWGGCNYAEPALKISFADGVRDLKLRYEGYRIEGENQVILRLADTYYPVSVEVHYKAIPQYDLIERYVQIYNGLTESVRIEQVMAAVWTVTSLSDHPMTHVQAGGLVISTKIDRFYS